MSLQGSVGGELSDGKKLTIDKADSAAPVNDAPRNETPEETLRRLNDEGKKDS